MENQIIPHAVFLPFPAQGHVNPLMQLAKLLHARGFHITFVYTEFFYRRLVGTKGSAESLAGSRGFCIECLPDGLPENIPDIGSLCTLTRKNCLGPFRDLLSRLMSESPPPSFVISDAVMTLVMPAAREVGLPEAQFWTASACGFMGYFQFSELLKRGIIPLKDESCMNNGYLERELDWVPSMKGIKLKDMPTFAHTTDPNDVMLIHSIGEMNNCTESSAIILNTFYELEKDVIDALASYFPPIYTIGPLASITAGSNGISTEISQWESNEECLSWLDKKEPGSVVYVNFGSVANMSKEQTQEFAWGLARCGFDFLWVLRPNVVKGETQLLEDGFLEEIKERGLIIPWCPQERVLEHPSLGLFVTHAGWNSLLETIIAGVPVLCWPIMAEQTTNCWQVYEVWGNGLGMDSKIKSDRFVELVRKMMVGEFSKEKRKMALQWKRKAEEATKEGGSSLFSLEKFIKHALLNKTRN